MYMDIKPSLSAIRSIASEFARSLYTPIVIIVGVVAVVLLALSIWLVTLSQWWLILLILICGLILFASVVFTIALIIIKKVAPTQTRAQRKQTKEFVEKLLRVAEVTATPKFILFFQVMKDVVKPSQNGFIGSITSDTTTLKSDFIALKDSFNS